MGERRVFSDSKAQASDIIPVVSINGKPVADSELPLGMRRAQSIPELGALMEDPQTEIAFLETPPSSAPEDGFKILGEVLSSSSFTYKANPENDIDSFFKNQVMIIKQSGTKAHKIETALATLAIVKQGILDIASAFPNYSIAGFQKKGPGQKEEVTGDWHTDKNIFRAPLVAVRTFSGPSTEYAEKGKTDLVIAPDPGSIVVHRSPHSSTLKFQHQSPKSIDSRFAVTIFFLPKELE